MNGPPCDVRVPGGHAGAVVGPTFGDGVRSCFQGPSGIRVHNPGVQKVGRKEGTFLTWPNGAEAELFGAHSEDDADRLRSGGNKCVWWFDEFAIARHGQTAIDNIAFGARLGPDPRGLVTTTPKAVPQLRALMSHPNVVTTHATSFDNPHIARHIVEQLRVRYEGTRLGRQELLGELLDDYMGALWHRPQIDGARRTDLAGATPEEIIEALGLVRIVIGYDPSTWDPEIGDDPHTIGKGIETGIVAVGIDAQYPPHVYVLEDASVRASSENAASTACAVYYRWRANCVVPERNLGGAVLSIFRLVDPNVAIYRDRGGKPGVHASVGKRARAEPSAALYETGRGHHVGDFPALEAQQCGWDPLENWSPDRIDALVWGIEVLAPWTSRPALVVTAADREL